MPAVATHRFKHRFTYDETDEHKVPARVEKKFTKELYVAGTSQIALCTVSKTSITTVNTLLFPTVKGAGDIPELAADEALNMLVACARHHNEKIGKRVKYGLKANVRQPAREAKPVWVYFSLDVASEEEGDDEEFDDNDEEDTEDNLDSAIVIRELIEGVFKPMVDASMSLVAKQNSVIDSIISANERRTALEIRKDESHIAYQDKTLDKLHQLADSIGNHTNNQIKMNQAGWDAFHEGMALKREFSSKELHYEQRIEQLEAQVEHVTNDKSKSERRELIEQLLPVGLIGVGESLRRKGMPIGNILFSMGIRAAGALGEGSGGEEEGEAMEIDEASTEGTPSNGAAPPAPQGFLYNITHVGNRENSDKKPLTCLARLLAITMSKEQIEPISGLLGEERWGMLNECFKTPNDDETSTAVLSFFASLGDDQKKLEALLSPYQRRIIKEITQRMMGEVEGPLDRVKWGEEADPRLKELEEAKAARDAEIEQLKAQLADKEKEKPKRGAKKVSKKPGASRAAKTAQKDAEQ